VAEQEKEENPQAPHPSGQGRPEVSLRRRFLSIPTLVSFTIAALLLVFLVTRFDVNLGATWDNLKRSNPLFYLLAILTYYSTFIFRGARWRILLLNVQGKDSGVPSLWHCGGLILLSWFANCITWFRLGDAYRAYTYTEDTRASFPRTIGTILAERVLDVVTVFLILLLVALTLFLRSGQGPSWLFLGIAFLLVVGASLVLLGMVLFRSRFAHLLPRPIEGAYHRFHQGTLGSFKNLPMVVLLGGLGWLAEVGRLFFVLQALGLPLSIPMVIFVTLANAILTLVPVTPGGLGIVETGVAGLLMLSLSKGEAISVALLDRSISYLSIILFGGLVFLGREFIKRRRALKAVASIGGTERG
jgi:hypothetical protein